MFSQKWAVSKSSFFFTVIVVMLLCVVLVRSVVSDTTIAQDATTVGGAVVPSVQVIGTVNGITTQASTQQDPAVVASSKVLPLAVQRIEECHDVTWQEATPVYTNCSSTYDEVTCSDPPVNKTCSTQKRTFVYACVNETIFVSKSRQDCVTTGFKVNGQMIDTREYRCSVVDDGKTYVTCDSIYDGNGDGVCTSGESCIQFGIVGSSVFRKERNSQDVFVDNDNSYYLARAEVKP